MVGAGELEQHVRSPGIVLRPEIDGKPVVPCGCWKRVERERTISRIPQRDPPTLRDLFDVLAGGAGVLEGRRIVVRQHLGVVLGAAERLEPFRSRSMLVRALGSRDLLVRDVAYERVPECVLVLARDRAPTLAAHEFLASERVEPRLERPALASERAQPEDPADHSCVLEELLLVRRQRVEAGGDDALHRLGEDGLARSLAQHSRELLRVERVAACVLEQPRLQLCVDGRAPEKGVQKRGRLALGERRKERRRRVDLAAAPTGTTREQLGTRRAEGEQRDSARPVDEVVDEVEQRLVGPVQVLEDEDERAIVRYRLEEATPGRKRLLTPIDGRLVGLETCQRPKPAFDPSRVRLVRNEPFDRLAELARGLLGGVRLENPSLCLDHLAERPERHALPVRK